MSHMSHCQRPCLRCNGHTTGQAKHVLPRSRQGGGRRQEEAEEGSEAGMDMADTETEVRAE
eukprot:11249792-Alexandrium_andersonii.AAC.1